MERERKSSERAEKTSGDWGRGRGEHTIKGQILLRITHGCKATGVHPTIIRYDPYTITVFKMRRLNFNGSIQSTFKNPPNLQSTRFTHERSTSNFHRLVHSSISFFEKFSDSANLGFYIRSINFVVRNFRATS